jgi:hypothetical protein
VKVMPRATWSLVLVASALSLTGTVGCGGDDGGGRSDGGQDANRATPTTV